LSDNGEATMAKMVITLLPPMESRAFSKANAWEPT